MSTGTDSGDVGLVLQWVRWFETPGEAAAFFSQYRLEQDQCADFAVDTDSGEVEVEAEAEVEDIEGGDEAYVLKTTASYEDEADQDGEQYVMRAGNVIMMLSGGVNEKFQKNALHAAEHAG